MNARDNTNSLSNAEELIEQLDALQPGKQQQKVTLFQKLYPAIERALGREAPQKLIVDQLAGMGLQLSIGGFRALLATERKLRAEKGEYVHCQHCGSILSGSSDASNLTVLPSLASLVSKDEAMGGNT